MLTRALKTQTETERLVSLQKLALFWFVYIF